MWKLLGVNGDLPYAQAPGTESSQLAEPSTQLEVGWTSLNKTKAEQRGMEARRFAGVGSASAEPTVAAVAHGRNGKDVLVTETQYTPHFDHILSSAFGST